eukprot:6502688-Karenia_brevis.AAC.1
MDTPDQHLRSNAGSELGYGTRMVAIDPAVEFRHMGWPRSYPKDGHMGCGAGAAYADTPQPRGAMRYTPD